MIKIILGELFKATFTHLRSNYATKKKLETALSSLLYQKNICEIGSTDLNLSGTKCKVW